MIKKAILLFSLFIILPLVIWLIHEHEREPSVYYMPYDLVAIPTVGDTTGSITLGWFCLNGDLRGDENFPPYIVQRSNSYDGPYTDIDSIPLEKLRVAENTRQYRDNNVERGQSYYYRVKNDNIESNIVGPIISIAEIPQEGDSVVPEVILFPPTQLRVFDTPNDEGGSITLEWKISPNDSPDNPLFNGYDVFRSTNPDGPFDKILETTGGMSDPQRKVKSFNDSRDIIDGQEYYYYVTAKWNGYEVSSEIAGSVISSGQWFHKGRSVTLVLILILISSILYFISKARSGKELFIRRIAGLEAVDEAVGRATEMGKPIFYVPGIQDMNNMQTIAGLTILGRVARLTAEYETHLEVPVSRSLVMVAAREIVKEAYLNVGRPDYYNDDMIYYLTDDQFGYAAGVDGLVMRKKPATIFYQGAFFAESLILAETGNYIGAIQIAGTAMPTQLPFFVAACDYTLIGEELFAASAYLSREPKQLGSLKGQDIGGKLVFLSLAIIFVILSTIGMFTNGEIVDTISQMFMVN